MRLTNFREDEWLLDEPNRSWTVDELDGKYNLTKSAWRAAAKRGLLPGAFMTNERTGWRISSRAIMYYIERSRREHLELTDSSETDEED